MSTQSLLQSLKEKRTQPSSCESHYGPTYFGAPVAKIMYPMVLGRRLAVCPIPVLGAKGGGGVRAVSANVIQISELHTCFVGIIDREKLAQGSSSQASV